MGNSKVCIAVICSTLIQMRVLVARLALFITIGIVAGLLVFPSPQVHAAQTVPYKVNFQGRLTDSAGNVMPDGPYNIKFRLYDAVSGGTVIWSELRETTNRVQVTNGLFSVQLGDVTALSSSLFTAQPLYFEVELPTPATATCSTASCASFTEGAMTPRQPLASSPYAMNADTLDGIDAPSFARRDTANTFTNTQLFKNSADSIAALSVQNAAGTNLLNIDSTNGTLQVGSYNGGTNPVAGKIVIANATNANTVAIVSGATSSTYQLTLPTALGASGDCLKDTTGAGVLGFGSCGGGASSMQGAYDGSGSTNPQILLSSTNGGLKIQDGTTPVTGNLFQIGPNGSTTTAYLAVSASAVTLQDAAGNNALVFDSTTSHLKVYENATSPTRFADVYYDTTTSSAIFAASSGMTQIGTPGGSGSISLLLTGANDQLLASKTNTLAGAYSTNDFKFTRNLIAGANTVTGNVMTVEDLTGGSSVAPNVLYVNQNNASATGNLILAQTGGTTDKFKVTTAGNMTLAGGVTIGAGSSYTGAGAVTLQSAAATALTITSNAASTWSTTTGNLTLVAGGANSVILKPGTDSANALQVQNASGTSMLDFDSSANQISVGVSDTTGTLLVLDTKTGSGDPTGVNGGMYYNSNAGRFRCYENGAWADCLGYRHLITTGSDTTSTASIACMNVTGASFAVTAGVTYHFHGTFLRTATATTIGAAYGASAPASPTLFAMSYSNTLAGGGSGGIGVGAQSALSTCTTPSLSSFATTGTIDTIDGIIKPSASGTFQLMYAPETATAGQIVKAGGTLEWW